MWTILAVTTLLGISPGQPGELTLTNARCTMGILGAPRSDNQFLPGDTFSLAFDIDGVRVDDAGKVKYSVGLVVHDSKGKVCFKQAPVDREAVNSLGGNSLPGYVHLSIGLEDAPGTYTVELTVTDRASGASKSLSQSYEVLPKGFGLVRPSATVDPEAQTPAVILAAGQRLWLNFAAVGFGRDGTSGQPNLNVVLSVLDESGKQVSQSSGQVTKDVPKDAPLVPMQFAVELNRAGKFTLQVAARDGVTGKESRVALPFTVHKSR